MKSELKITYFKPERQGVFKITNGYSFALEAESDNECGVLLYANDGSKVRVPFSEEGRRGTLYGVRIETKKDEFVFEKYNYYIGDDIFTDPYARLIAGLETWGDNSNEVRKTYGLLKELTFDWEDDLPLEAPVENMILYGLNVRAFTMHATSGVKNKGTYEGVAEKIPYLKKLGITAIELMPTYEYDECMRNKKINCWGFQQGFNFAPKASYAKERADISFKKMVKEFHKSGIEVVMQFYFPPECKPHYMVEVLKYWVSEYHIDGIRISGFHIPLTLLATEPVLKRTKIRSTYFPIEEIYADKPPVYRNLLCDNGDFKNDMRRYLKGDENLVSRVINYQRCNPSFHAVVNYLTDYDGLSLYDLVSYERKHNEANGEDNRDGTEYNYSWNCGVEGESRKRGVVDLRKKQVKNALSFIFLSQGIPYLFSGDEFANTRYGNNNCYCQDNETGYVKWKMTQFSKEIFEFTCDLIKMRKENGLLHKNREFCAMDADLCGYPEISYHGTEAWRPDISYVSRILGIMLCGKKQAGYEYIYIAYNMHWENHELALPNLPKGKKWSMVMTTFSDKNGQTGCVQGPDNQMHASARSVSVYCAVTDETAVEENTQKKKK